MEYRQPLKKTENDKRITNIKIQNFLNYYLSEF